MGRWERILERVSSKPAVTVLVLLLLALEFMFSVYLTPSYAEATGGGEIIDMSAAYPSVKVQEFLSALKAPGQGIDRYGDPAPRQNGLYWYNRIQIADSFFPLVYGLLLSGLLYRLYRKKYGAFSRYRWIIAIPTTAAAADYLENLTVRILILADPAAAEAAGFLPGLFSAVKFAGILISFLFLLTGLGYFVKGRRDAALAPGERRKSPPQENNPPS